MKPIGQEPIPCLYCVRWLDVRVHPLVMTLVCSRVLPPNQPLMLSAKHGGIKYNYYLWCDSAR